MQVVLARQLAYSVQWTNGICHYLSLLVFVACLLFFIFLFLASQQLGSAALTSLLILFPILCRSEDISNSVEYAVGA